MTILTPTSSYKYYNIVKVGLDTAGTSQSWDVIKYKFEDPQWAAGWLIKQGANPTQKWEQHQTIEVR